MAIEDSKQILDTEITNVKQNLNSVSTTLQTNINGGKLTWL